MTKVVDFYFELASPFAYLASTQIDAVCASAGATANWKPFCLGPLFKATGNQSPVTAFSQVPNKMRYMQQDMRDWAEVYGVPFAMPAHFPLNTIPAARACLAAGEQGALRDMAQALYQAYWRDGKKIDEVDVIKEVAAGIGLDGEQILARIQDQDIKDQLKANVDDAVKLGAFGAPTMAYKGRIWWGNDRLHLMAEMMKRM